MGEFLDYFTDNVDYPDDIAENPLPIGVLYEYVSSTFLNGFINYVKPVSAYLLDRYEMEKELPLTFSDCPHSNLAKYDDDVLILAITERFEPGETNIFYFFWFDMDVSDCKIGRFATADHLEIVKTSFSMYLQSMKNENAGKEFTPDHDNGVFNFHEIPVSELNGWISF